MKNSNQKSASETVCGINNLEVASENSATREAHDVLNQILREGAQKMLQSAIQQEVDRGSIKASRKVRHRSPGWRYRIKGGNKFLVQTESLPSADTDLTKEESMRTKTETRTAMSTPFQEIRRPIHFLSLMFSSIRPRHTICVNTVVLLIASVMLATGVTMWNVIVQRRLLKQWNQSGVRIITWQPPFSNTYLRAISPSCAAVISSVLCETTLWQRPIAIACVESGYKLNDDDLAALSRMTSHLSLLDVQHCNVTGKGLQHLQRIESIRQIDLCGASLVNADLEFIGKLKTLESLNLSRTQVTDAGLIYLYDLKNLKVLDLTATAVTSEGVSRIQSLPNLKVLKWDTPKLGDSLMRPHP